MDSDDDLRNKKTRYRVPTVCTVCRRRKIKCDKQRPHCVSCVKNRTTHMCHYEEQPWAADNEVQKLKEQLFQLQHQNNELKTLLNKRTVGHTGNPLDSDSNTGLLLPDEPADDPVLQLTENFDLLMLKESKMAHYGSSSYMAIVSQDPVLKNIFRKYLNHQNWGINLQKYFLYDQGILPLADHGCGSLAPFTPASVFEADLNSNHEQLVKQVNEVLPDKEVLDALIDHFFSEAYAFVPFLDENAFRKNVESLVSVSPTGKAILVLSSVSQLVSVATLLTVMRFAYLSLPMKNQAQSHNFVIKKILDSNVQIPPNYIELAKACMANASALRKPTMKHIQALLALRLYRFYAPEDGDESSDSTIFLALIVQMARMHGLHRDPSRFEAVQDHATANVWRKIWFQLLYLDAYQALQFGCPLLIDEEYDTELPIASSHDSAMEKACIESFVKMREVTLLMRALTSASNRITAYPKRSEIEKELRNTEYVIMKYRSIAELSDMSNPNESFLAKITKVKELAMKVNLYNLQSVFYYILMLTCEPHEITSMKKYTTKAAEASFIVFRACHRYSKSPQEFVRGLNSEMFLSATIFDVSKRCLQMIVSFSFRDLSGMFNLQKIIEGFSYSDSQGMQSWLTPFDSSLTIADQGIVRLQEYIQACAKMSNRYFTCWRLVFINKAFEDYLDTQFPGKFEEIHRKIEEYNKNSTNDQGEITLDLMNVNKEVQGISSSNSNAVDVFEQLLDRDRQSKFDYLVPDLNKFENFGEPFYDNMTGFGASFEDYNNIMSNPESFTFRSFSTGGASSTDDVSPKTDSSDVSNLSQQQQQMRSPPTDLFGMEKFTPGPNGEQLTEQELAMQVAQSMFGGSTDMFGSGGLGL